MCIMRRQTVIGGISLKIILLNLICIKKGASQCGRTQWDCDDGECISVAKRCDGNVDCNDGSDEISKNCLGFSNCQSYAFRCTYGACINGRFRCNGRQDCADNSDELLCSENREAELQGSCKKFEVQCFQSRECIHRFNICDGNRDCSDGTDETVEMCAGFHCPELAFQCGNGACINGNVKCNGTNECPDDSDESWQLCAYSRPRGATQPGSTNRCQVPKSDSPVIVFLHPDNRTIPLGRWVNDYETIHIECASGSTVNGYTSLLCRNGRWSAQFPTCITQCDAKYLRGLSTYYICRNNNYIKGNCLSISSSTEIEVRCNPGYEKSFNDYTTMRCSTDGRFNVERPRCKLSCGRESSGIELANKGLPIRTSEVPWLVAIYQQANGVFNYVCAGTIISPSVILTAAHCFWNDALQSIDEPRHFRVAAGKYYRDYNANRDNDAQFSDVHIINVSSEFGHASNNFYRDLAVVKLQSPLVFTKNISAICVEAKKDIGDSYIDNGIQGSVSAWGANDYGEVVLQRVLVRTKSYRNCLEHIQNLRGDKFCLEYEYESQLCRGDSGAGFIRLNPYTRRFELVGIISYAVSTTMGCVKNGFTTVTNIYSLPKQLQLHMEQYMRDDEALF